MKNRNKILNSIPKIIQKIKNINDDKENHQSNLFDQQEKDREECFASRVYIFFAQLRAKMFENYVME